jgi:hypothetical protein
MKSIRVQVECPQDKLPTVLSLLSGEVTNIATRDMAEVIAARQARSPGLPTPAEVFPPNPSKPPTRLGRVAIKALVAHGARAGDELNYSVIAEALVDDGFAYTSHASAISQLVERGTLARIGHATVRVLTAPVMP